MAWYNNQYVCPECCAVWDGDWSCGSDDECPKCEARNISPVSREDLTVVVKPNGDGSWTIWRSSPEADDSPRYQTVGKLKLIESGSFKFVTDRIAE